MRSLLKKSLIIFTIISASSCQSYVGDLLPVRPSSAFKDDFQGMSLDFQNGWKDGCENGMSSGANTFYKIFYSSNKIDGYKFSGSSDYKTAFGNAYWYCYRADHIKQKSSIWGSVFSGYN